MGGLHLIVWIRWGGIETTIQWRKLRFFLWMIWMNENVRYGVKRQLSPRNAGCGGIRGQSGWRAKNGIWANIEFDSIGGPITSFFYERHRDSSIGKVGGASWSNWMSILLKRKKRSESPQEPGTGWDQTRAEGAGKEVYRTERYLKRWETAQACKWGFA